jgi:two-component system sensor histidine kinase/response regulator
MNSSDLVDSTSPGHILVVDDLPANAKLLAMILKLEGFEVSTAAGGLEALHIIEERSPDVVLLDAMMPGIDGFETCRRIRAASATQHLPVVIVTALHEVSDRVRALEAGADDFIAKPVEEIEVVARVRSLVRAKRGRDELEQAYDHLRRAEGLRDSLTQMLVHDLRTPLTALLVSLDILGGEQAGPLNDFQKNLVTISSRSGGNLMNLINDLLDVARLENGQMTLNLGSADFSSLAEAALGEVAPLVRDREAQIEREWAVDLPLIEVDSNLIRRVLVNLLSNSLKFSPQKGKIAVGAECVTEGEEKFLKVWVQDNGFGITPEHHERIWDKFAQAEARQGNSRVSTGLGLTFCKLVVEVHGGRIGLESEVGKGSTFHFILPLTAATKVQEKTL